MIRSSVVASFLVTLTLSFVHPRVATADPIVTYGYQQVRGWTDVPYGGGNFDQQLIERYASSGPVVANVQDAAADADAVAVYAAGVVASLSPFLIDGVGSSSTAIETLTPDATAQAFAESWAQTYFTLDGNYDYSLSGFLSASDINSHATVFLYKNSFGTIDYASTSNSTDLFSFDGTLSAGNYYMYGYSYSNQCCDGLTRGNADFDLTFILTPSATVPEPSSMWLVGLGVLTAYRRLRRS